MKLYRKVIMNGHEMIDVPFKREFELEGCIASNPELLSLDDDEMSDPSIIAMEAFIKNGRKNGNGRVDIVVAYSGGKIGIVELKKGVIDASAYKQLAEYMIAKKGLSDVKDLKDYLETEDVDLDNNDQVIGLLVGTDISEDVIRKLDDTPKKSPRIYPIVLKRSRIGCHDVFIFANVYQSDKGRDYTKYKIGNGSKKYGKARLVHEVIRKYVESHPNVQYKELLEIFPNIWRGVKRSKNGCFVWKKQAMRQKDESGYTRHFLRDEDIINLADGEIAVSTQWGLGNIKGFVNGVNGCKKIGIKIFKV